MSPARDQETKAGGQNERFREHRISHFWLQARGERNCCGRFLGAPSDRGLSEGHFSAPSIDGHRDWPLSSARWDVRRFGSCKTDLESRRRNHPCETRRRGRRRLRLETVDRGFDEAAETRQRLRKQLAQELGYTGALDGSAEMNVWLHKQVMAKLAESGGKVPDSLKA